MLTGLPRVDLQIKRDSRPVIPGYLHRRVFDAMLRPRICATIRRASLHFSASITGAQVSGSRGRRVPSVTGASPSARCQHRLLSKNIFMVMIVINANNSR